MPPFVRTAFHRLTTGTSVAGAKTDDPFPPGVTGLSNLKHKKNGIVNYDDAIEWLLGKRSWTNVIPQEPVETWHVRTTQADAASTQQAYWIVKAHHEGLLKQCGPIEARPAGVDSTKGK